MIAMYVTHISNELEPIKGVCYGQIGTYVRVHVLFITNDVKYITYFKEKILPTLSCTIQLCSNHEISLLLIILIVNTYVHNWNEMPQKRPDMRKLFTT